ncbi:type II toxin-antitoxin system RelE/ParE family toxin [Cypionkella sp.]|uniref:type II toxin-antitoxin system RelE/ParE family toxin n=1 Tax=Cypionkella sp. TaxID=2811411 RepID=UPI00271F502E|nr:type II toxin-antitoxin system RelE/ParE family toxin [Cypionkella sp.]MDO8986378.1 type II toxin-antitoxin system RelE/ParE family toxin [Cypionkella sp.]MDP1576043.1 type II toxin-antitoxin system RelE/ParE family toxin [Cypionkella sp.]MDP2050017.1 type II toxin-antitoxin system RelE/ParE family toxin [Cypionkella sp.]
MPKPWVLTRQAEAALKDIAIWTVETFGKRQADAYAEDLIEKCQELADGAAPSRDCRRLVDSALPEDLRYARSGQHYVVFVAAPARMIVVDFLHVRTDILARLAALGEGDMET